MAKITKDTTIGEAIQIDAGIIPILMSAGMHCVGCPSSAGETIEEAAMVDGRYNRLFRVCWLKITRLPYNLM